jgi:hypothetical protein
VPTIDLTHDEARAILQALGEAASAAEVVARDRTVDATKRDQWAARARGYRELADRVDRAALAPAARADPAPEPTVARPEPRAEPGGFLERWSRRVRRDQTRKQAEHGRRALERARERSPWCGRCRSPLELVSCCLVEGRDGYELLCARCADAALDDPHVRLVVDGRVVARDLDEPAA